MENHRTHLRQIILASVTALFVSSCGGWKSGYYSMPYIGERAPSLGTANNYEKSGQQLPVPGLSLSVSLFNDVQTSDTAWFAIAPVKLDFEEKPTATRDSGPPGTFCTFVQITTPTPSAVIHPKAAIMTIDGVAITSTAEIYDGSYGGPRDPATGRELYKTPPSSINIPIAVIPGLGHSFYVCFPGSNPSPDRNIQLDLSRTIQSPYFPPIPLIKFQKRSYRLQYS